MHFRSLNLPKKVIAWGERNSPRDSAKKLKCQGLFLYTASIFSYIMMEVESLWKNHMLKWEKVLKFCIVNEEQKKLTLEKY